MPSTPATPNADLYHDEIVRADDPNSLKNWLDHYCLSDTKELADYPKKDFCK